MTSNYGGFFACRVPAKMTTKAPTFTQPLQSVVALEGSAATFEAHISGKVLIHSSKIRYCLTLIYFLKFMLRKMMTLFIDQHLECMHKDECWNMDIYPYYRVLSSIFKCICIKIQTVLISELHVAPERMISCGWWLGKIRSQGAKSRVYASSSKTFC